MTSSLIRCLIDDITISCLITSSSVLPDRGHKLDPVSQAVLPVYAPVLAPLQVLIPGGHVVQGQYRLWGVKGQTGLLHRYLELGWRRRGNVTPETTGQKEIQVGLSSQDAPGDRTGKKWSDDL